MLATSIDGTVRAYRCDLCGNLQELLRLAHRDRTLTPAELKRLGG